MYFALLIHAEEGAMPGGDAANPGDLAAAVEAFDRELSEAGRNLGSLRLCASNAGSVIRVRGGHTLTVDGPFAETKEQLGGIYLVEADDAAAAAELAAKLPLAAFGSVEVRELVGVDLRGAVTHFDPSAMGG